jgi:hypothetical protein
MNINLKTSDNWAGLLNEMLMDAEEQFGKRVSPNPPSLMFSEKEGPVTYRD